jgi:galactokinase
MADTTDQSERIPGFGLSAQVWLTKLEEPDGPVLRALHSAYGTDESLLSERVALITAVVRAYLERFGEGPIRLFRCPGRINLRGMHVDTHGGWLNLMTHHREVVAAVSPTSDRRVTLTNVNPHFTEVTFDVAKSASALEEADSWLDFITSPAVASEVRARQGDWGNYLRGACLRVCAEIGASEFKGMKGVVGGDLVSGAALSSSHALCTCTHMASLACNDRLEGRSDDELILSVRDAEWYTGARSGVSDQAAMILAGRDELVNAALLASDLDSASARRASFPDELDVLVVNSYTERSLSGRHMVEYSQNRFAYSLALEIVRQELARQGLSPEEIGQIDRLPALSPERLQQRGSEAFVYTLLRNLPERLDIDELRERYELPHLDALYDQYFGGVDVELRPTSVALRGPLLFGIAESERGRLFFEHLDAGDFEQAGRLMTIGHDGDRRVDADGNPFKPDLSDPALQRAEEQAAPVAEMPGVYGASTPVLDGLVDAALQGGALGASLTGAGLAGSIIALCRREQTHAAADSIRAFLGSDEYARRTGNDAALTPGQIENGVLINRAPAGAGELVI